MTKISSKTAQLQKIEFSNPMFLKDDEETSNIQPTEFTASNITRSMTSGCKDIGFRQLSFYLFCTTEFQMAKLIIQGCVEYPIY